jgi:hypothetical protein
MRRANLYLVLAATFLAAGCSSSRENLAEAVAAAPPPTAAAVAETASTGVAPTELNAVVDGNELAQRTLPICRDLLKPGSNVIVTQCMSAENWRIYKRREEQQAQELVRLLQGGRR